MYNCYTPRYLPEPASASSSSATPVSRAATESCRLWTPPRHGPAQSAAFVRNGASRASCPCRLAQASSSRLDGRAKNQFRPIYMDVGMVTQVGATDGGRPNRLKPQQRRSS
jgi:hypothetical protein